MWRLNPSPHLNDSTLFGAFLKDAHKKKNGGELYIYDFGENLIFKTLSGFYH